MSKLGLEVEFVDGLRVTDQDTVDVAKMVLSARSTRTSLLRINRHGQLAVGISGDDGGLFRVSKTMPDEKDIGFVGKVDHVNTGLLDHIRDDYISVIASVGIRPRPDNRSTSTRTKRPAQSHTRSAQARQFFSPMSRVGCEDADDPTSLVSAADHR